MKVSTVGETRDAGIGHPVSVIFGNQMPDAIRCRFPGIPCADPRPSGLPSGSSFEVDILAHDRRPSKAKRLNASVVLRQTIDSLLVLTGTSGVHELIELFERSLPGNRSSAKLYGITPCNMAT